MNEEKDEPLVETVVYTLEGCDSREIAESVVTLINEHRYPSTTSSVTLLGGAALRDYDPNDKTARITVNYGLIPYKEAEALQGVVDGLISAIGGIYTFTRGLATFRQ